MNNMSPTGKPGAAGAVVQQSPPTWGFLTNHALVLVYIVLHPDSTVRTIAHGIGITERATLSILRNYDDDDLVFRTRDGRRNIYSLNFERLGQVRRGGVSSPLTPRLFVEGIVRMLFALANQAGGEHLPPPARSVREHELEPRAGTWGFFTNHQLVLLAIARDRTHTVRELAAAVNITERAVLGIVGQLDAEGIVTRTREGRRTTYAIDFEKFRMFRGWSFPTWSIPEPLIDAATNSIRVLAGHSLG